MVEVWLPIDGFPGYEVSSQGRVYSLISCAYLKPGLSGGNYLTVSLYRDRRATTKTVHSLVADAFYDGDHAGLQVNHEDGDKLNNFVGNLEYGTQQHNLQHARDSENLISPGRPKKRIRILQTGEIFESIRDCANYIGGSSGNIVACLKGRLNHHKGYTFELVGEEE